MTSANRTLSVMGTATRQRIETLTDELAAPAYDILTGTTRARNGQWFHDPFHEPDHQGKL